MAWQQIHLQCANSQVEMAETFLMEAQALSIVMEDAGDQPLFEPMPGESPLWDDVIITAIFDASLDINFEEVAHQIAAQVDASRVWLSEVEDKNWEREWMKNYHPIECANNLWIVPNWITPPKPEATNIIMDPGLAFGTGYHATTRLCLDWLTEQDLTGKTIIDYGCGSGILGIAALLLGAKQVYSVDIDPQAVIATNQNADRNQVADKLQAFLPEAFTDFCEQNENILPADIITANILAKPLISLCPYFATLIKQDGKIVLSGLIESQLSEVNAVYNEFFSLEPAHAYVKQDDSHWQRLSGQRR